jgi:hypothetical protein
MRAVRFVLGGGLLAGMALTPKLWTADSVFPSVPAMDWLPHLPQTATLAMAGAFALAVAAAAVLPKPGRVVFAAIALGAVLVLFDLNRLQPWLFGYLLMLAGTALWEDEAPDSRTSHLAWGIGALVVASIYFWSGLQKANLSFGEVVFPWLLGPLGRDATGLLSPFWWFVPLFETLLGVSLLVPKTRVFGLAGAVAMHAFLLLALGPFGHDYNSAVWPWNLALPVVGFLLFWGRRELVLPNVWGSGLGKGVALLVGVLPALSFLGKWDEALSFSLYSGTMPEGWIAFAKRDEHKVRALLPSGTEAVHKLDEDRQLVSVSQWALDAMNAPPHASSRVFREAARALEKMDAEVELFVSPRPLPWTSEREFVRMSIG